MDNKILKTFLSVARHKNFSNSAKALHTTQPTVSRHISELESELGVQLFDRTTHHVNLTASGEWLYPEAIKMLAHEERIKSQILDLNSKSKQILNIGYLATACDFFLPHLVSEYADKNPAVVSNLNEMGGLDQAEALIKGGIDVGFCRHNSTLTSEQFNMQKVYDDQLVVVLPVNHLLAQKKSIRLEELIHDNLTLFERVFWPENYDYLQQRFQTAGSLPISTKHPENMRHLITLVSTGQFVSIAPRCISSITNSNCVTVAIEDLSYSVPLYIYWRRSDKENHIEQFVKHCIEQSNRIQTALLG